MVTRYLDDLDGSDAHETIEFSFRGRAFEIDLSELNAKALHTALEPYLAAAREVTEPDPDDPTEAAAKIIERARALGFTNEQLRTMVAAIADPTQILDLTDEQPAPGDTLVVERAVDGLGEFATDALRESLTKAPPATEPAAVPATPAEPDVPAGGDSPAAPDASSQPVSSPPGRPRPDLALTPEARKLVRRWSQKQRNPDLKVGDVGRIPQRVIDAYNDAHS
jgi:hypothetical protein